MTTLTPSSEVRDTTIADIHRTRERITAKFKGNIHAITADAKRRQAQSICVIVSSEKESGSTASIEKRIDELKAQLLASSSMRSDGKPVTPQGLTREFVLAILERAGTKGLSSSEIRDEFPHRSSRPGRLLRAWRDDGTVIASNRRYFLPKYGRS